MAGKGGHDLRNAEHTLTILDDCPFDTMCFHSQQCVEKYLNGWLAFSHTDVLRSHDLVVLLNLAMTASLRGVHMQAVQPLNRYTIEARYPGDGSPSIAPKRSGGGDGTLCARNHSCLIAV
jgi:HEPN domain-containing protein